MTLRRVPGGFKVFSKRTGRPLSKAPLSYPRALAQLRAVELSKRRRR